MNNSKPKTKSENLESKIDHNPEPQTGSGSGIEQRCIAYAKVTGLPKAQPRARVISRGGKTWGYTKDNGVKEWKGRIRYELKRGWDGVQRAGAVSVLLSYQLARPMAHIGSQGLKRGAPEDHIVKPDLDNLDKAVLDAITELGLWKDDSQVVMLLSSKEYSKNPTESGCEIQILEKR